MEQLQEMLFRLCRAPGAAGREDSAAETARELLSFLPNVKIDTMGCGGFFRKPRQRHPYFAGCPH